MFSDSEMIPQLIGLTVYILFRYFQVSMVNFNNNKNNFVAQLSTLALQQEDRGSA